MPLGNGDVGINLWVEENGDLFFYIGKTDAWSENARLLKLGRIRIHFIPNPFQTAKPFKQTLNVKSGTIHIQAGETDNRIDVTAWVDANESAIHVESIGMLPHEMVVSLESWRTQPRELKDEELHSAYGLAEAPFPVVVTPDVVVNNTDNEIVWYHRNERSIWPLTLQHQGLESLISTLKDPLLQRTFGGLIAGLNFAKENPTTIRSAESDKYQRFSIVLLTAQTDTIEEWLERLNQKAKTIPSQNTINAYDRHEKWWNEFWNRSAIHVSASGEEAEAAECVTRGYALQRFISACAGRGGSPIKFNGSIFNVDARIKPDKHYDADYRLWGGPYWFQNTRLVYWPMLMSGDFDMMRALFDMYLHALPFAAGRTRLYFNHNGAFFPETMYFWGAYAIDNYGWDREGKPISHVDNRYIRYYWDGALELLVILADAYHFTQNELFLNDYLIPIAAPVLQFYDEHYSRDKNGRLRIEPSQALETWQEASNPLPVIAGLQFVTDRLMKDKDKIPKNLFSLCKKIHSSLPNLPKETNEKGEAYLLPAEKYGELKNSENPELYAIFPYRIYGMGKPDLNVARLTFEKRLVKRTGGWTQDPLQAALLGMTEIAKDYTVQNFSTFHDGSRFPAFWGPNFDWIPDQDHGNISMLALQNMLMQCEGKHILLFPAWPKQWNVTFKLYAPMQTIVEGIYQDGEVKSISVSPASRRNDVEVMMP
ncbi:MAG: hypothetical protein C4527_09125 [Candidatus Omnitrophota bacterium]|nr:MAG: hypothetical protein C4527_09125 [Candidatus Omnitrophota bacterium]